MEAVRRMLALMCIVGWAGPAFGQAAPAAPSAAFPVHPLARIEPGTRVANGPPVGWSQLILKSQPRVTSGDMAEVPKMTLDLVGKFFNVILARVEKFSVAGAPRYRLAAVAIGLGTHIGNEDIIVSSATRSQLGVDLGMVGSIVLTKSEEQLDKVVELGRSSTMTLIDSPTVLLRGGVHVDVVLRYAVLADPRDGRVYTIAWILDRAGDGYQLGPERPVLLKPNQVTECPMHVDRGRFFLGTPGPEAFAVTQLPAGTPLAIPPSLARVAAATTFTPRIAYELEVGLWKLIFPGPRAEASRTP